MSETACGVRVCKLPERVNKQCSSATCAEELRVIINIDNDYTQIIIRGSKNCEINASATNMMEHEALVW